MDKKERNNLILKDKKSGVPQQEIADKYGVSISTVAHVQAFKQDKDKTKRVTFRLSDSDIEWIAEMASNGYGNQSEVVREAIRRMRMS